jgi:GNAT superfamily N-acetyltransferase
MVLPPHQRKGYGKLMIEFSEFKLRDYAKNGVGLARILISIAQAMSLQDMRIKLERRKSRYQTWGIEVIGRTGLRLYLDV